MPPYDLPAQPAVFAPDYAPEEIKEIAAKLRKQAGLPNEPEAVVANDSKAKAKSKSKPARKAKP